MRERQRQRQLKRGETVSSRVVLPKNIYNRGFWRNLWEVLAPPSLRTAAEGAHAPRAFPSKNVRAVLQPAAKGGGGVDASGNGTSSEHDDAGALAASGLPPVGVLESDDDDYDDDDDEKEREVTIAETRSAEISGAAHLKSA